MKKAQWGNGSMRKDRPSKGLYKAGTTARALVVPPLGYASCMVSRGSRNFDGAGSWLLGVEGFDVIDIKYTKYTLREGIGSSKAGTMLYSKYIRKQLFCIRHLEAYL